MSQPTTVGALIEHLKQFPAEMEVLFQQYSDYEALQLEHVTVVKGVKARDGGWVMRAYETQIPTMSEHNKQRVKEYLLFPGN